MPCLRVGVIGCGPIGALHASAMHSSPVARLVSVCDLDHERAEALARRVGGDIRPHVAMEQALAEGLDVVTVATPDHRHVDVVLSAIEAGCHVFCEKPLATTSDDARRMVEAARRRGVHLGVDYNRRFGFGYQAARRLVDEGKLGAVRIVQIHVLDRTPPPAVALVPEVILTTLLTHHLDLARWFGGEVTRLHASTSRVDPVSPGLWREIVLTLEFEGGAVGSIVAGYRDGQARTYEQAQIVGSHGSVQVDDVTRGATFRGTDPDRIEIFEPSPSGDGASFTATITGHVRHFLDRLAAGLAPPVIGEDGLHSLELVAAARRSQDEGRPVIVLPTSVESDRSPDP